MGENLMAENQGFLGGLGIYTKFASQWMNEGEEGRLYAAFYLQSLARKISPKGHRVKQCLRVIAPNKEGAEVRLRGIEKKKASYGNLIVCASIWACPICASRITEERRKEIERAVTLWKHKGYKVVMLTYTFSHTREQSLKDVLATLKSARRRFKSGRKWQYIKSEFGIFGTVGAIEVTWGANGWHPHSHELLFIKQPQDSLWEGLFEGMLQQYWLDVLAIEGASGINNIALKLSVSDEFLADYIAKFGREPSINRNWDMVKEVSKAPSKKSKSNEHCTPLELLIAYGNKSGIAAKLWVEYVTAFKGKKQLVWSVGLKDYFGIGEISEDEIALDNSTPYDVLAVINPVIWGFLMKEDKDGLVRSEILKIAQNEGLEAMLDYVNDVTEGYKADEPMDVESIIHRLTHGLL